MTTAQPVHDQHELPRVTGRHRNRALASQRRTAALKLVSAGMTYQQAADLLGYRNRGTVHRMVSSAMRASEASTALECREDAMVRLERLLSSVWNLAMAGDLRAVAMAMRIVQAECKLQGLYEPSTARRENDGWPCCQGAATVVVRQDDCRWAGCHRHGSFSD